MPIFWFSGNGRFIAVEAINEDRAWQILARVYCSDNKDSARTAYRLLKTSEAKRGEGVLADIEETRRNSTTFVPVQL